MIPVQLGDFKMKPNIKCPNGQTIFDAMTNLRN